MSQLSIENLNFLEHVFVKEEKVLGGRITPRIQVPRASTAAATAADTNLATRSTISGNLVDGFRFNRIAHGSTAAAAASAVSLGGTAYAFAEADAG